MIVRGLKVENVAIAQREFQSVMTHLIGTNVQLHGFTKVKPNLDIYRVKIPNNDIILKILENAKVLKTHPKFNKIYIQKDLTYLQRQYLYQKRLKYRQENVVHSQDIDTISSAVLQAPHSHFHN